MANFWWRISTLFISTVFFMASFSEASVSILCPNDTAVAPSSGETLLPVNFAFPTIVEEPSGIPVNASCSHESGDMFPLTETDVSCMATDGTETAQCSFKVKVGKGAGCRVKLNQCLCRSNTCTCKEGYTGVVCDIADGTTCGNGSLPVNQCNDGCPVSCGCNPGWQGPSCDVVDDGSQCDVEGTPRQCVLCLFGTTPPCVCELGWNGVTCENDYQPPKFTKCPSDTIGMTTIGEDSANVTWDDPQAVDNAGGDPIITCDPKSGSIFTAGVTRVTCTATDDSSNSASDCVFSVTVSDNKTPDILCPDSDIWNVDTASALATVVWSPLPSANDSIDGRLNVTCRNNLGTIVESGNMFPVGMTMVTCSASDKSGNSAMCNFNVTVLDTEGPVLMCSNNTNKNVEPGKPDSVVDWSLSPRAVDTVEGLVPDIQCADNEGNVVTSGDRFIAGKTVVSCSASDSVGNRGNCSFNITVIDNEAPLMTCPRNTSQDIDPMSAFGTVDWLSSPMANDTIDGVRDVQCSDDEGKLVDSGDKFPAGVTIVTCKASDRSNNEGNCNFVVTVTDNEAPVMACSESISQNVRPESAVTAVVWPTIPAANDTVDGPRVVNCTDDLGKPAKSGDEFPVGLTEVTCKASDRSGNVARCNFTVTVIDNEAPLMACSKSISQNVRQESAVAAVIWPTIPAANDTVDGPRVVNCTNDFGKPAKSGDKFPVGLTEVTCEASDSSGNVARCNFTVTVIDNEAPAVTCPMNFTRNVEPGKPDTAVNWYPLPAAKDAVEGLVPNVSCVEEDGESVQSGSRFSVGMTKVTCSAMDSVGNEGNCSFVIAVIDNEPPIMTCPENITQNVDKGSAFGAVNWPKSPSANDTVDGQRIVLCSDVFSRPVSSGDTFPAGVNLVMCKTTDESNNEAACNITITVTDNEPPIMTCPGNITQNVDKDSVFGTVNWPESPSANDTVDGQRIVLCSDAFSRPVSSGDTFPAGVNVVMCKTTDESNNEAACNITITVTDNEPPIMTCPENITQNVDKGSAFGTVNWPESPSANDTVDGQRIVLCSDAFSRPVSSGDTFPAGVNIVTCKTTDEGNNEAACNITITVTDNEPPIMTCPENITQNVDKRSAFGTVNWPESPSANDTVDGQRIVLCSDAFSRPVSSGDTFPAGVNVVMCKTTDESNNEAACNITITVTDNEPPIMTCPENITQNVDKRSAFGTVNWPESPSANDTVDGQRTVLCSDAFSRPVSSGDTFPAGVNVVTCKTTDESNNEAACNITITVTDNEAPIMTCPANTSQDVDQGSAYASVDWPEMPTANDTVDGPQSVQCVNDTISNLVNSGEAYPVGFTRVTCNARDSSGNKGRCDFTVTVTDNEGPFVICPGEIGQNVEPGKADAQVHWPSSLPRAWDVVEVVTPNVTCARKDGKRVASGDRFTAGDTLVTCSAADSVGNEGNCSFVVSVIDNEAPMLICPANLTMNVNGNMATGTLDWPTSPSANDTVDGVRDVQCTDDTGRLVKSGDGFPVGLLLVTCAAYDRSNNEGNCSFMVTVTACEPCQNGGFSQDPQTCNCSCLDPYTGPLCSDCKECVNGNKQNRSTCACECFNLYTGSLCDDCIKCMNGGLNQDPHTCMCSCPGFYLPPLCEECDSVNNCQNGGEFSETSCSCSCTSQFSGKNCTECQPCQNGGSYQNQFTCACDCPYFHTDPLCSVCPVEFTCLNGGTSDVPTCSCQCAAGWTGRDCSEPVPNLPNDEYPVSPLWTVAEKKVSFEVAVIAPVDKQCDPSTNKHSAACDALVAQFKIQVETEYKYVTGFSHVNVDQDNLRSGSVVIPHEVVYKYNKMTPSTRGISANALYEETLGRAVDRGWIGTLRVASAGCNDCMAPKDNTNICNAIPPSCAPGLVLTKRADSKAGTCYYVCQSKCKVDLSYCGEGTCQQEPGSEEIHCNCPQSSTLMYSGSQCQRRIHLVGLYVGVGVGGLIILLLIVVLSACLCRRRAEMNKLDKTDQEKEERYVYSTDLIGKLNDFQNGGHTRASYNHDYATQSTVELYSKVIKTPSRKPTTDSPVDGTKTPQHVSSVQDKNGYQTRIGDRRSWYFWGSQSLPKKQATEIIPMTSETGTF